MTLLFMATVIWVLITILILLMMVLDNSKLKAHALRMSTLIYSVILVYITMKTLLFW